VKLNILIWTAFCGIILNNKLLCCSNQQKSHRFDPIPASMASSEDEDLSTYTKLESMRLWVKVLTNESKNDGINPLKKSRLLAIINNLNSILKAIKKDQSDAKLG